MERDVSALARVQLVVRTLYQTTTTTKAKEKTNNNTKNNKNIQNLYM